MNRHLKLKQVAVATTLALMTGTAWAASPSALSPAEVQAKVRDIDWQQQLIVLEDGTELSVITPEQLDQIQRGTAVKVLFMENGKKKEIQRIERIMN